MDVLAHWGPVCGRCGVEYAAEGDGQTCSEPTCNGRVTWEAKADVLAEQLRGAVGALVDIALMDPSDGHVQRDTAERALEAMGVDPATYRGRSE